MIPDMPRKLPLHVTRERDRHGKVRFYFRIGKGKRTALPSIADDVAFDVAYRAALAGKPLRTAKNGPRNGTLGWLIANYMKSNHWAGLKASTRARRGMIFRGIDAEGLATPAVKITKGDINQAMEKRSPHTAVQFHKAMTQMFKWAEAMEFVPVNPCVNANRPKVREIGFHTWTMEEVVQFRDHWPVGTQQRLAMELLLCTGLRRADIYRLGRQHVRDGEITIRTEKTGAVATCPVAPWLQSIIDATPCGDLTFLQSKWGRPFANAEAFGVWFSAACKAAGVPGSAHGLRKAGATAAADGGSSSAELMSLFTWARLGQADTYTKAANRKMLARAAAERIANAYAPNLEPGSGKITNPPKKSVR